MSESKPKKIYKSTDPLDKRTKWTYSLGATGRDMAYALVSMYLLIYIQYTMTLTTAQYATISGCIVVCLIWDAINDPMMGLIIENAHFKSGKYRPWILAGMLANVVVILCLFTLRPSGWAFVGFFCVFYCLWGMTFTMNDISYWGLLPSLTSNTKERNTLTSIMSIFCSIGQFLVAGLVPSFVVGQGVTRYRICALIVCLFFCGCQLLTYFGVRERERDDDKEKVTLKKMFHIIGRNDQLMAIGISCLLFNICNGLLIIFGTNFFYFEFGYQTGANLIFLFTVMYGLGTLASQALYAPLAGKFGRKAIIRVMTVCIIIGYLLFLGVGYVPFLPKNFILLDVIGFLIFFCQGLYNVNVVVMLNNTIEYDEYKNHERHDSVVAAVRSFCVKLSSAINQGANALVLIISGIYAASQSIADLEVQSGAGKITAEEVLTGADQFISQVGSGQLFALRLGIVIIPIITIILSSVIIGKKYKIDEKMYGEIVDELAKRNETAKEAKQI